MSAEPRNLKTVLAAAVFAFGASALISYLVTRDSKPEKPAPVIKRQAAATGPSYAALLVDVDQRIEAMQKRAEGRPSDWLIRMNLGSALFERAGLTSELKDLERVQAVLDDAFAIVAKGAGPVVLAARFNFSIHRLPVAEEYLDMIDRFAVPRAEDTMVARLLRGQIALQRGQYAAGFAGLTEVARVAPAVGNPELALYHAKTGDPARAEALLAEAFEATHTNDPRRRAWMKLQLAIVALERGQFQAAMEHLQAADRELSGWWLVHEHIAEVHARRSEHDKAIAIYEELVRTFNLPQHMDALASLYGHTSQPEKAAELVARAGARWEEQAARFPESAMGHGLRHYLQFGAPERALELALANHKLRPGGDAEVLLARAYMKANQPAEALAAAERALATPYRTASLHDVAAKAHAALGHTAAAEEQVALCLAINPAYSSDDHSH